jgi:GINS complex subunit 4
MDIDDILADVDTPSSPEPAHDLRSLTRTWVTERAAPEVLPWPVALVDRVVHRMTAQTDEIERRTAEASESQGPSGAGGEGFSLVVLQTEMERCKFLVRSLLRARLAKVRYILRRFWAVGESRG